VRIAVGPEGGFTDEEVALAINRGWLAMNLGPRILRIETAAIALAARFNLLLPPPTAGEGRGGGG
jgi:16S rRNA (uracil1498-N3)-methyltransferase